VRGIEVALASSRRMPAINRNLIVFCTIAGLVTNATAGSPAVNSPNYPLTIVGAVELALRQNPSILNQIEEIKRNQGLVLQARAALIPQVQGTAGYSQQEPTIVEDIANESWSLQITVTQLLWDGGAALANRREAKSNEEAAYYALRDTIDNVVDTVRTQFYRVILDRALVEVQEEAVNLLKSEVDDQQGRVDAGTGTRFDVLQAQTQLQNQLPVLITAQKNYLLAQATLAKILGIPAGRQYTSEEPLPVSGSLDVEPFEVDFEKALAVARLHRPLLKTDRKKIAAALANRSVVRAGSQPSISANAAPQSETNFRGNDLRDVVNGWQFGVSGQWNILDGGTTYGKVKAANSQLEEAKITLNDAERQVEVDVFTAMSNLHRAKENMIAAQKGVEVSLRSFSEAYQRRTEGKGSQLDVFDARNQLTLARSTFLRSEYQYLSAIAQYQYVTGTETTYNHEFDYAHNW
jgi:outer membrane protein TolC